MVKYNELFIDCFMKNQYWNNVSADCFARRNNTLAIVIASHGGGVTVIIIGTVLSTLFEEGSLARKTTQNEIPWGARKHIIPIKHCPLFTTGLSIALLFII